MSNSKLATINMPASHYSKGRDGRKIEMITIHHMAGVLSAKQCGNIFQGNREASSHYGIGNDGEIAQYVDEANTAWANGNWDANCKAVTIETSNNKTGGDWTVGDKALNSLIKLVADIAKRNNLGTLVKGKNVTWHSMYCSTTCPGNYLRSKMDYIVSEANKINNSGTSSNNDKKEGYLVTIDTDVLRVRAGAGTNYDIVTTVKRGEVYTIVEEKNGQGASKWGRLKSGAGWISLDYTDKYKSSNNSTSSKYVLGKYQVNTAKGLNVRSGAGTNHKIVKAYTNETRFDTYEIKNNWARTPSRMGMFRLLQIS